MYSIDASSLTKDILLSNETIESIFSEESEIDRQIAINKYRQEAKKLKCLREYDSLIMAAKQEVKRLKREQTAVIEVDSDEVITFDTEDGEIIFNCGSWRCDELGVFILDKNGKAYACTHPIFPKRILKNAEDGSCKVELIYCLRGRWGSIQVPKSVTSSSTKIVALADQGIQVNSENAKLLVKYLADIEALNPELIYEQTSTSRLGWVNGTFVPYCQNSIVFDNEQSLKSLFTSVTTCGDKQKWMSAMLDIRQRGRFEALVYMAASFASVLVEPCGTLPFIVSIWGGSGKGKTVALMMAASIWANPGEGKYMADAKATTTAMEIRLDTLNSLPMCLDDMAQVQTKFDGDFSQLIYYWCQGKGRERSNQSLGLNKPTKWSNCTLTNGERSMITETTQGGAINRVIDIEIEDSDIFVNGNKTANTFKKNYGFGGEPFVKAIQTLGFEAVYQIFEGYCKKLQAEAKAQGREKEDKQITPMALILTADEISERFIFEDGVRLDLKKCLDVLKDKDSVSEHVRAYEFIEDWIAMNAFRFWDKSADGSLELWGHKFETDSDTYAIIQTKLNEALKNQGFQPRAFISWAVRKGLVQPGTERTASGAVVNSQKFTLGNGTRTRCYVIKLNVDLEADEEIDIPLDDITIPFDN